MSKNKPFTPAPVMSLEAKQIVRLIIHDMMNGQVPLTVANFTALHDHVDANEYLIEADLDYMTDEDIEKCNAVTAEVNGWFERQKDRSESAIRRARPAL